jgi:hypothetical protein
VKACEAKINHIGVAWSDSEFAGDDGVLLAVWICRGVGDSRGERVFSSHKAVAAGIIDRAADRRILATAAGEPVCSEAQLFERCFAVVGGGARCWDDLVSAGDCRIHCGSIRGVPQVKGKFVAIGFLVAAMAVGAAYLWVGSAVPPGQEPLATLTQSNFSEFENSFDKAADGPRLVLLLSPT